MSSKHSKKQKQWSKNIACQTVAQNTTSQAEPVKTGANRNEKQKYVMIRYSRIGQ